ncbi:hypothetical protein [Mycoplasma nasistruthionis]|uniref:Uncharacterized protein n=1 Tax=Mycoplasma nasistruthionis TaxID=353852 RepID=A0A4Y6I7K0_9MOLU|nr:hypothetical protein [Mycoplasma nasistruthionis]QDF64888.1 hypothetical protein FIV53_00985 [Mycoplasma nasistruthionis]
MEKYQTLINAIENAKGKDHKWTSPEIFEFLDKKDLALDDDDIDEFFSELRSQGVLDSNYDDYSEIDLEVPAFDEDDLQEIMSKSKR